MGSVEEWTRRQERLGTRCARNRARLEGARSMHAIEADPPLAAGVINKAKKRDRPA